jgi:hypothetical protein
VDTFIQPRSARLAPLRGKGFVFALCLLAAAAILLSGCSGDDGSTSAISEEAQSTSGVTNTAPTTTEPPPLSAEEIAWWKAVDRYARRLEKEWHSEERVTLTHAVMRRWSALFEKCRDTLKEAGDPGRYAPVDKIARRACEKLAKAKAQVAIAIGASDASGAVLAGSAEEAQFNHAIDRVFALAENALNDFSTAGGRAAAVESRFGT